VPTHVIYHRSETLLAAPMDWTRLEPAGAPFPLVEQMSLATIEGAPYSVSSTGVFAYLPGTKQGRERQIVWVDRTGRAEALPLPPDEYEQPVVSPDGLQFVVQLAGSRITLAVSDVGRPALTPIPTAGDAQAPVWTPDSRHVVYRGTQAGTRNLFMRAVDGSGLEERLTNKENVNQAPESISRDGHWLAYHESGGGTAGIEIWVVPLIGDRTPRRFISGPYSASDGQFSPDGHWLAYQSTKSGRSEIWMRRFPDGDDEHRISTEGGAEPMWSSTGRELFFINGDKMMAVDVNTDAGFAVGVPHVLYQGHFARSTVYASNYSVTRDGLRFLRVRPTAPDAPMNQVQIVLNWFEELKQKLPVK
jgi:hypothetical protein